MIYFLKGVVRFIKENIIVLDVNNIGYQVYVTDPNFYHIDDDIFLYTYQINKQEDQYLIGFKDEKEKETFKLLLKVAGIGPKGALNILKQVDVNQMIIAIKEENINFFNSINGVNTKTANQIILDLKSRVKHFSINVPITNNKQKEIREALLQLGFKKDSIELALSKLDYSNPVETILKEALTIIKKI